MRMLIATMGAFGIVLMVTGLPAIRRSGIAERVEPYLNGLGGRSVSSTTGAGWRLALSDRLQVGVKRFLPDGGPILAQRLAASGTRIAVPVFRVEQLMWGAAAICICAPAYVLLGAAAPLGVAGLLALSALSGATGAVARDWWLSQQIARRRERVRQEMPVALDLLTLALMAGEAVPAAFARVGSLLDGDVGEEFRRVVAEIRSGTALADAIPRLGTHVPHPCAARLADGLVLGLERGAPIAEVLRGQADDLRHARRRDLLEMGGRREIAMLVPVVFLILPVTVVFVLLPGLVSLDLVVP